MQKIKIKIKIKILTVVELSSLLFLFSFFLLFLCSPFCFFFYYFYFAFYFYFTLFLLCVSDWTATPLNKPDCHREQPASSMFFRYNTALGPPYHVLLDTNFINFSIQNKLEIIQSMMDCLYSKCKRLSSLSLSYVILSCNLVLNFFFFLYSGIPYITDCVMAEIEKLGPKFKVALK